MGNLKKRFPENKKILEQSKKLVNDWKAACSLGTTPSKPQNGKTPTKAKETEEKKETKKEESPAAVDKKRKLSSMHIISEDPKYLNLLCM